MPWQQLNKAWFDTTVDHCDVCGNLLIRRYWAFPDEQGEQKRVCAPRCEELDRRLKAARSA
jgi:hypothetical protein